MANYKLSNQADADLENINIYGIQTFGLDQAYKYHIETYSRFEILADFKDIGMPANLPDHPDYLKFPSGVHIIYYTKTDYGIFIGRILHGKQQASKQVFPREV